MHKFMTENTILEQSSCAWVHVFKIKGIVTLPSAYPQPAIKLDPHILTATQLYIHQGFDFPINTWFLAISSRDESKLTCEGTLVLMAVEENSHPRAL